MVDAHVSSSTYDGCLVLLLVLQGCLGSKMRGPVKVNLRW